MTLQKEVPARLPEFRGVRLSVFLFGVLSGAVFAILIAMIIGFSTDSRPLIPSTIDRMFVIKSVVSASSILITIFAVTMTIRSQIRQHRITSEIDKLYEKTGFLSSQ